MHRDNPGPLLETTFERIRTERMAGMSMLNPALAVAAVGFERQGNEWRGALVEFTQAPSGSANVKVQRQWALRGSGVAVRERIDTQAVAAVARAMARGLSAPRPGRGVADLMPVALLYEGYSEVWFLPVLGASSRPVVGGDSLIQMKADGSAELPDSRANFTVGFYDFPVIDNTRLPSGVRCAVTLSNLSQHVSTASGGWVRGASR